MQSAADTVTVIERSELPVDTVQLARYLIGKLLVRETPDGRLTGRIVETEAYPPGDAASHAYRGETPRNRSLFLRPGLAYIYRAYGTSWLVNVSSEVCGVGAGVLIRAVDPIEGIAIMEKHRRTLVLRDLTRGPGRLAAAFDVDRRLDGVDLCQRGPLWLGQDDWTTSEIGTSGRIGLSREGDRPLRFHVRGNRFVSGSRALNG